MVGAKHGASRDCFARDRNRSLIGFAVAKEIIDLGNCVLVQLRGKRLERLGGKGFVPRLFQIVVLREGKIASIRDYAKREDALSAVGVTK